MKLKHYALRSQGSLGIARLLSGCSRTIANDCPGPISGILTTTAAAALLFAMCERLSAMAPVESDSASAILQGQALATGNVLLRGWTLSKASFLATDLPFYAASALLRGVSPQAARDAGSAIYTLLILMLLVFGVDFFARPRTAATQASLVHLVGLVVVAAVWCRVIISRRSDKEADLVTRALAAAIAIDVAAYLFSNQPTGLGTARYLLPLLVFGAVLAGRHATQWLTCGRRRTLTLAVAGAYAGVLMISLEGPVPSNDDAALTAFLAREHLTYGLSDYWDASSVTVATRSSVLVRPIAMYGNSAHAYRWEAADAWFDASIPGNDARFVLHNTSRRESPERRQAEAAFGPPSREWRVGDYEVWVWDRNLLHYLDPAPT